MTRTTTEQTPRQIGNYIIERAIGRGATSEVWLAHHAHLDRKVAIKLLMTRDDETIRRFNREANLISNLHHPHIVQIYDHGYYSSYYYSALEYIKGNSLQQLLDRVTKIDFLDALNIFKQIAAALDYAHSFKIIHRDVSPGNVLIEEDSGRALLTDFGIARNLEKNMTIDSRIMGTPGYWSPEHARSATEVTHLSDLYGLGVIFYAMLCGDLPWEDVPIIPSQSFASPVPLSQRGVKLPAEVDRIVEIMLSPNPNKRFPTALAAVDELERVRVRHHATTQRYDNQTEPIPPTPDMYHTARAPQTPDPTTIPIEPDEIETALGSDLVRAPITEAHERARQLSQPEEIAALLDGWAKQGFYGGVFRRPLLGRIARMHTVRNRNIYFYNLKLLYEQRGHPQTIEEPDKEAKQFPLEPEIDHWHVPLPTVQGFENVKGDIVILPGSSRVVSCETCAGKGKVPCKRCKGQGRIWEKRQVEHPPSSPPEQSTKGSTRTDPRYANPTTLRPGQQRGGAQQSEPAEEVKTRVEKVLVPCPECNGQGGNPCARCESTGRLVQQKAFRWQRVVRTMENHDDISVIDEKWLYRTCKIQQIYHEQVIGDATSATAAFHPEWMDIPRLKAMVEEAEAAAQDEARIVLSELTIGMLPITDIVFDLGNPEDKRNGLYRLTIWGFEKAIPADWRLLDWERVLFFWVIVLLLVLTGIFGFFAFLH
jgi:serine/threonine protein kinase